MDRARMLSVHQSDPDCLARFKAERVDGLDESGPAARIGTACHRACEMIARECDLDDEEGDFDRTAQLRVASLAIDAARADLPLLDNEASEALRIMGAALSPKSHLRLGHPTGWNVSAELRWGLDRYLKPCSPDDPKRLSDGTIDRCDWHEERGRVVLKDYKTTKHFQTRDEIRHAWQPRLYSLWALANFQVRSVTWAYVNLRHGYEVREEFHVEQQWHAETTERLRSLRAAREVAVEFDQWPATEGPGCDYCVIRHRCDVVRASANTGRRIDPSLTPAQIGARYLALTALASDYERAARAQVQRAGEPIDLGHGVALGLRPATGWRLAEKYLDEKGKLTPELHAKLLADLRDMRMTKEQEERLLTLKRESDLPGAVSDVLYELFGRHAGDFIERGYFIEQFTRFEFGPWLAQTRKAAQARDLDEILDDVRF